MILYAPFNKDLGLLCIRIGLGLIFIMHGWGKLTGGQAEWTQLGMSMQYLGITFMPVVWGLLAACVEFFGGISLLTGFCVRWATLLMAMVMLVALIMHVSIGEGFKVFSYPLSMFFVFIGLAISGAGSYAVDK